MITKHKNGDAKTRAKVEYRLTDANWHTISGLLSQRKYGSAQKANDEDYPESERDGYVRSVAYANVGG